MAEQIDFTLRFRGVVALDQPIDTEKRFTVSVECECNETTKRANNDGTTEYCYKADMVHVVDLTQEGKKMKVKDTKSRSKQLRNVIWRIGQNFGVTRDEQFYEAVQALILTKVEDFIREMDIDSFIERDPV